MSAILKVSVTIGIISLVLFQYQDHKGLEDQLSSNVSEWLRQGQFLNVFGHQMYYRICGHLEENEKQLGKNGFLQCQVCTFHTL